MRFSMITALSLFVLSFVIPLTSTQATGLDDWKKNYKEQERLANQAITDNYKEIAYFAKLADKDIQNPAYGMKLHIEKKDGKNIFKLEKYDYDLDPDGNMSSYTKDTLTITFDGKTLQSAKRVYKKKVFNTQKSIVLTIVDNSPLDENHNGIVISRRVNDKIIAQIKFGNMVNKLGNTERTDFKLKYAKYIRKVYLLINRIGFNTIFKEIANKNSIMEDFPSLDDR